MNRIHVVLSKWHGRDEARDPPVPAEVHFLASASGNRRGRGVTHFTDGSMFVDGGVGFGCGPDRYRPSAAELAHPERLYDLGLTNRSTGLHSNVYWVEGPAASHGDFQTELRLNLADVLGRGAPDAPVDAALAEARAGFLGRQGFSKDTSE